jgi:hypothetical protein
VHHLNQPHSSHPVLSNPVPIMTTYPGSCLYCGKSIPPDSLAWWEAGHGVVHEDCFGRKIDSDLAFSLLQSKNLRRTLSGIAREGEPDVDTPDKSGSTVDIDASKKRIEEVRKRMGWPSEHN